MSVGVSKLPYLSSTSFLIPHLFVQDEGLDKQARARLLAVETFQKIPGIGWVSLSSGNQFS